LLLEAKLPITLALSGAAAYGATPWVVRLAKSVNFYDLPAGGYKDHARPTPYLGGLAVLIGFFLVVPLAGGDRRAVPLVAGMAALCIIGTVDDRRGVSWLARVGIEAGAAVALWRLDLGWHTGAGDLADVVVTVGWLVLIVNAFNIFDNMDGVAAAMAGVVAAGATALGIVDDDLWLAAAAAALCGACLGFLPHNLASPARIFLGDGGSMAVGFAMAVLVMGSLGKAENQWPSFGLGLLLIGVPTVDCALRVIARRRTKVSFLTGGRDGLAHWWKRRLGSARAVAGVLTTLQVAGSTLAVFAVAHGFDASLIVLIVFAVVAVAAMAFLDVREVSG
jgi:UDP-GlcNAc:undecaprenyl-phosphate GlcNAc-1-phosphate transferase